MILWIISAEVWVICWGGRLGFDNSWYHAKAKFNNSFVEKFLKQSAKVDFLWVCKSLRTVLLKLINNSCWENKGNYNREGGLDMWS